MKSKSFLLICALCFLSLTGCYWNAQVQTSQVGLIMFDGVKVNQVVGAGRYTKMNWYADIRIIDTSAKTLEWEDPDLVTRDKQPISLRVGVTYRRNPEKESILRMWDTYRGEATSDEYLKQQVLNRIPRTAKGVTTKFTIDEMLGIAETGGREVVQQELFDLLEPELSEVGITLLDVGINDIGPDPDFLDLLKEKAQAQIKSEVAKETTKQLAEQLLQEKAQTDIDLEKARRQNAVNEELAQVYADSPEYLELERLRLLSDVIGQNDKIYFVPGNANLTLFLGGNGVAPVVPSTFPQ
jgi:regulator of protease activity HflC (stomatin/prohibitin superfamily)